MKIMKTSRRDFLAGVTGLALTLTSGSLLAQTATKGKTLIVFYSWSGNTRFIAQKIQEKTGADLTELELVKPYSTDYSTCLDEAKRDQRADARPQLKTQIANMADYDTIIVGYPTGGPPFRCRLRPSLKVTIFRANASFRFTRTAAAA